MRISELLSKDTIILDLKSTSKNDVINELAEKLFKSGNVSNLDKFKNAILERESESTTGIGDGIAIPHAKTSAVKRPGIAFGRSNKGVDYDSLDKKPVSLVFMIAASEGANRDHLEALSRLSVMLMDDTFQSALRKAVTIEEIVKAVDLWEKARLEENDAKENMNQTQLTATGKSLKLLAITSCPNGIAHTYMAAENLQKAAKK